MNSSKYHQLENHHQVVIDTLSAHTDSNRQELIHPYKTLWANSNSFQSWFESNLQISSCSGIVETCTAYWMIEIAIIIKQIIISMTKKTITLPGMGGTWTACWRITWATAGKRLESPPWYHISSYQEYLDHLSYLHILNIISRIFSCSYNTISYIIHVRTLCNHISSYI